MTAYVESEEFQRMNAEISAAVASRGQGVGVALLALGDSYYEVLKKEGDDLTLCSWNSYGHKSMKEMEAKGYKALAAVRIIKANGTIMYYVKVDAEHTDWYVSGHHHPAIRRKT